MIRKSAFFPVVFALMAICNFCYGVYPLAIGQLTSLGNYKLTDGSFIRIYPNGQFVYQPTSGNEQWGNNLQALINDLSAKGVQIDALYKSFGVSSSGSLTNPQSLGVQPGLYGLSDGSSIRILPTGMYSLHQPNDGPVSIGTNLKEALDKIKKQKLTMSLRRGIDNYQPSAATSGTTSAGQSNPVQAPIPLAVGNLNAPGNYELSDGSFLRVYPGGQFAYQPVSGSEQWGTDLQALINDLTGKGIQLQRLYKSFTVVSNGQMTRPQSIGQQPGLFTLSNGGSIRILPSGMYSYHQPNDGPVIVGTDLKEMLAKLRSQNATLTLKRAVVTYLPPAQIQQPVQVQPPVQVQQPVQVQPPVRVQTQTTTSVQTSSIITQNTVSVNTSVDTAISSQNTIQSLVQSLIGMIQISSYMAGINPTLAQQLNQSLSSYITSILNLIKIQPSGATETKPATSNTVASGAATSLTGNL